MELADVVYGEEEITDEQAGHSLCYEIEAGKITIENSLQD